ncbi:type IV pilus biogenesis/stability protein PilW [Ferrimonas gelatinilytica]|uniref:Type IV pilus biogenesis/stability protein PilW n=2 Tax=Ferrimonas gelatinilytica TaxID=1255257 RepID=A0ABP9S5K1_9GAMM
MRLFSTILVAGCLAGCVQNTTYSGTDTQVAEARYDANAAARDRISLGLAYLDRGEAEQAKFNLEKALEHAPKLSDALLAMAYYYDSVQDEKNAEIYYRKAVDAKSDNADAANNLGVFYCRHGRYPEAERWLLKAVETPGYIRMAQTYENLGLCTLEAGWTDKAAGYFEKALNYDGRRAVALLELAKLDFAAGRIEPARRHLKRYHQYGDESADSLLLAAELAFQSHNADEARRYGVLLLAKFPGSEQAKTYRTKYY